MIFEATIRSEKSVSGEKLHDSEIICPAPRAPSPCVRACIVENVYTCLLSWARKITNHFSIALNTALVFNCYLF